MNSRTANPLEVAARLRTIDLGYLESKRAEIELIALDNAEGDVDLAICTMIAFRDEPSYAADILGEV